MINADGPVVRFLGEQAGRFKTSTRKIRREGIIGDDLYNASLIRSVDREFLRGTLVIKYARTVPKLMIESRRE